MMRAQVNEDKEVTGAQQNRDYTEAAATQCDGEGQTTALNKAAGTLR